MINGVTYMVRRRDLVKGSVDYLLLYLIGQQPMYGYQILKELEGRSQGYFKFKEGTLYPALHRLERAGLLLGRWQARSILVEKEVQWRDFFAAMNLIMQPAKV